MTLTRGLNFTLVTSIGDIDLLGEIPGGGAYHDLLPGASEASASGYTGWLSEGRTVDRAPAGKQ
jgi:hypothetical protein